MGGGNDGVEFGLYLWANRRTFAIACGIALAVTGLVSPFLPHRYTAKATLLVEPPSASDPRMATAVSVVYLDSLKTYQLLVASDTLFGRALDRLHLRERYAGVPLESLKQRILTVSKPTNTTVIEISVVLENPKDAQALAQCIAEEAVTFNASVGAQTDQDLLREPARIADTAGKRVAQAAQELNIFTRTTSVASLGEEVRNTSDLISQVGADLARARADLANYTGIQQSPFNGDEGSRLAVFNESQIAATRAKVRDLEQQYVELNTKLVSKSSQLEELTRRHDALADELTSARAANEAAKTRLTDLDATVGSRAIRLKLLDPGIVPQRPSFPHHLLNLALALTLSFAGCVAWIALRFAIVRSERQRKDPVYSLDSEIVR